MAQNFNIANFLQGAPTGLILYSKFLGKSIEFNKVLVFNKVIVGQPSEHEGPQHIIECLKYDDTGSLTDEKVYFDAYGRIKKNICADIIGDDVDLMPDDMHEWDDAGICALISESSMCVGKVLMDKIDTDVNLESPWFVGDTAMWNFDTNGWASVKFHKFDFSNVRFATEKETQEFFDILHEYGSDFKDGTPIKNGENAEPECRNATKGQFFNALSDLCENWKGTIPDADFQEVLFKFETEVIFPEMKKAFGWNSEITKDKD